jgi:hypothetical protein
MTGEGKPSGVGSAPVVDKNVAEAQRLAQEVLNRSSDTSRGMFLDSVRKSVRAFVVIGALSLVPGTLTHWFYGTGKEIVKVAIVDAAKKLSGVDRPTMERKIREYDVTLNEIKRIRQLRLDGKMGEWLSERIKEGVPRILGSIQRRTFNLESEKKLQQQRDALAETLRLYDEGAKEIRTVEQVFGVLEYLGHWFAWWGSIFSVWFGFLQTRRILDTRNQAQVDAKKLAQAILEVAKENEETMTPEEAKQIAEDLIMVKEQQQRILEIMARWEEIQASVSAGGPGATEEDVRALKSIVKINDALKGVVGGGGGSGSAPAEPKSEPVKADEDFKDWKW